jgi:type II secretion system protein G
MRILHAFLLVIIFIAIGDRVKASGNRVESDILNLKAAIESYRIMTGSLPPSDIGLGALVDRPANLPADAEWKKMLNKITEDPWGQPYTYILDSDLPGGFGIFSRGMDGISKTLGNDTDDYNSWSRNYSYQELNPIQKMPWLLPCIVISSILFIFIGVRMKRYSSCSKQIALSNGE